MKYVLTAAEPTEEMVRAATYTGTHFNTTSDIEGVLCAAVAARPAIDAAEVEVVAIAIRDAENGLDGDSVGTMLHENFRCEARDFDKGMGDLMIVCRTIARAVLSRYGKIAGEE